MGLYSEHVLPRCTDFVLSRGPILKLRERVAQGLTGHVVELGFGSGLNVPYYPASVTQIFAIEPSRVARRLAEARLSQSRVPVVWSGLDGQALVLDDASVDSALTTFTLCTIPDLGAALAELRRVLRPGARLHFLEHGRSPSPRVAAWQDRLTPLHKRLAGGCHLNRNIADQLRAAGFCLDALQQYHLPGVPLAGFISEGCARRC